MIGELRVRFAWLRFVRARKSAQADKMLAAQQRLADDVERRLSQLSTKNYPQRRAAGKLGWQRRRTPA